MSDLNDFFAKKDRKKKKSAAKSALAAASQEPKPVETEADPERVNAALPQAKQPDDGWIEIEDPKGSQVNTGGRTIVEFRRDVEEKEVNGDGGTQTEKFSGWARVTNDLPENSTDDQGPAVDAPRTAFPTLADAAKVKHVPSSTPKQPSTSGATTASRRPRFINSRPDKLRQRLAERAAEQRK